MEKTWGASHKAKVKVGPKRNLIINIRFLKPEILNNQEPFEIEKQQLKLHLALSITEAEACA